MAVLSTTDEHAEQVTGLGFPYRHVPVEPDGMTAHEHRLLDSIGGTVELAILARYIRTSALEPARVLSPLTLEAQD